MAEKRLHRNEILFPDKCMFGLTIRDVRELAYDFLKANPHAKNSLKMDKELLLRNGATPL
jgi:hypothetical protein